MPSTAGFFPQTALDEDDGTDLRLLKIIRKMKGCRYGVHDLSRIELNPANGIDTKAHNNDPVTAMTRVHSWLNSASRRTKTIPGEVLLRRQYNEFNGLLPDLADETGYSLDTLPFLNLLDIVQEVVTKQLA